MKERLIFARGKWEIARKELNSANGREQWIRRDQSWICYCGEETAQLPMPDKPKETSK